MLKAINPKTITKPHTKRVQAIWSERDDYFRKVNNSEITGWWQHLKNVISPRRQIPIEDFYSQEMLDDESVAAQQIAENGAFFLDIIDRLDPQRMSIEYKDLGEIEICIQLYRSNIVVKLHRAPFTPYITTL